MAAYGAYRSGGFYVTGMLGLSVIENESRRQVAVPGGSQALSGGAVQVPGLFEDLKGRYHSVMASGDLEAGYKLSFGTLDVTPFAGVQFATLLTESYKETLRDSSASSFGLSYARRVTHSLPTYLGLRLETKRWLSDEMRFSAWMQAAWRHEWSTDRSSRSAFLAAPGFDFTVQSAIPASNSIRASLGLDLRVDESISMFTSFEGDVSRTGQEYSGTAGFRIRW